MIGKGLDFSLEFSNPYISTLEKYMPDRKYIKFDITEPISWEESGFTGILHKKSLLLASSESDNEVDWSNYVYLIRRDRNDLYGQYNFRVKVSEVPSAISLWRWTLWGSEKFILASSPSAVKSPNLEIFIIYPDLGPVKFLVPKAEFEVYQKIKILEFVGDANYGQMLSQRMVAYTKSNCVVYYRLRGPEGTPSGVLASSARIQTLQDSENLIWAEILHTNRIILACGPRKCAIIQYAETGGELHLTGERMVRLGENSSHFSFNFRYGYFGALDASKNTIAFYRIDELLWPKDDLRVEEYSGTSNLKANPKKCRSNHNIVDFPDVPGAVCVCVDGMFWNTSTNSCQKCHKDCKFCSGASRWECRDCPAPLFYSPTHKSCYSNHLKS